MDNVTLTHLDPAPDWFVKDFLGEIDSKRFGKPFDDCFLPDTHMIFGASRMASLAEIKSHLQAFDSRMDTKHVVKEFWDSSAKKVVRGEITFTPHDTGETRTATFVHIIEMAEAEPGKIKTYYGAAGPAEGLL